MGVGVGEGFFLPFSVFQLSNDKAWLVVHEFLHVPVVDTFCGYSFCHSAVPASV